MTRISYYRNEKEDLIRDRIINIPCSILNDRNVAVLEAITEYLKDKKKLTYHEIALILNRDDRTIWTCYYRAKKKRKLI